MRWRGGALCACEPVVLSTFALPPFRFFLFLLAAPFIFQMWWNLHLSSCMTLEVVGLRLGSSLSRGSPNCLEQSQCSRQGPVEAPS
jgi:hypothetical protein